MAFNPSDDFREAWTARTVLQARRSLLAYNLGNNSSEPLIRSNYKYHVANPTISLNDGTRARAGSTGALADVDTSSDTDSGSIEWIEVVATGNHNWRGRIDDRDINYSAPITLGTLRTDIAYKMRAWVDSHIWTQVQANIPSGQQSALTDAGGVIYDISTGKLAAAGSTAQQTAFWKSLWDWLQDLTLELANAELDTATGEGDNVTTLHVTMMPFMLLGLKQYMRDTSGITVDEIKLEGIDRTGIRTPERWRGRLFDTLDLYVATEAQFKPTAAGTNNAHIIATIPGRSWDNAIMAYPLGVSPPDGESRKHRFLQEVEAWVKIIEADYIWAKTFDTQA